MIKDFQDFPDVVSTSIKDQWHFGIKTSRRATWEHSEDSSKGIELESINDVAGVDQIQTHEAEAHHKQNDVQHLRNQRQPQYPCKTGRNLLKT